jgi:transposase, IS5 family
MRRTVPDQLPLVPAFHAHVRSRELEAMSQILDAHPEAARWVLGDLIGHQVSSRHGREGMSGEQVLRVILVKQLGGFSYDELSFHLADSASYRAFCRIGITEKIPTAKTLQRNVKLVQPRTLEKINRLLVGHANATGIENGNKVRVDCTVVETNIHAPTDSSLLWDVVRVLTRLLDRAREYVDVAFTDHQRLAKRRALAIQHARTNEDRVPLYQELITVTEKTRTAAERTIAAFSTTYPPQALEDPAIDALLGQLRHFIELARRVVDQTRRRVVLGETVPATEKLVSIFETHTDIIIKDRRDTLYGHKLCLAAGGSGLITDCHVEKGNPADSTLAVGMIERHIEIYGRPPRQACFDGGFASRANLDQIKELEVRDVVFAKSKGIDIHEMASSEASFRALRRFRAGIEATISFLKRCVGWTRCTWRSLRSFQAYAWASVVTANLLLLARHQI